MKRITVTVRSYIGGTIREPGEEFLVDDDHPMHSHMIDVATGEPGERPSTAPHMPVFLDYSGDTKLDSSASSNYVPALVEHAEDGAG